MNVKTVKEPLPSPRIRWNDVLGNLKDGEAVVIEGDKKTRLAARNSAGNWARKSGKYKIVTRSKGDAIYIWKVPV